MTPIEDVFINGTGTGEPVGLLFKRPTIKPNIQCRCCRALVEIARAIFGFGLVCERCYKTQGRR